MIFQVFNYKKITNLDIFLPSLNVHSGYLKEPIRIPRKPDYFYKLLLTVSQPCQGKPSAGYQSELSATAGAV